MARKAKKKGKERLDKYYYLAKQQGYRARSAFKLIQLNKKFGFLDKCRCLIDLCAAPGGWLQVASKNMPIQSTIVGIDLVPIKPIRNVSTLAQDITTSECREQIKKIIHKQKAEVVLHDGSPSMGTQWEADAYSQAYLVLAALKLATDFLAPNGWFISKVFRSADYNALIYVFSKLFKKVTATKPSASRNTSAEVFVVCQGYLAPPHLNKQLLNPRFVFKEENLTAPGMPGYISRKMLFEGKRPKALGYDKMTTSQSLITNARTVAEFVHTKNPIHLLAYCTAFTYDDEESKRFLALPFTKPHFADQLADLKLLGRGAFKALLRWREKVIKFLEGEKAAEAKRLASLHVPTPEERQQALLKELEEKENAIYSREKRKQKKKLRVQEKTIEKQKSQLEKDNASSIDITDDGLFALNKLPQETLDEVMDGSTDARAVKEVMQEQAKELVPVKESVPNPSLTPEEAFKAKEDLLDLMYAKYLEERKMDKHTKKRLHFKLDKKKISVPIAEKRVSRNEVPTDNIRLPKPLEENAPPEIDTEDMGTGENELLVDLKGSASKQTSLWFSKDCFKDVLEEEEEEEEPPVNNTEDDGSDKITRKRARENTKETKKGKTNNTSSTTRSKTSELDTKTIEGSNNDPSKFFLPSEPTNKKRRVKATIEDEIKPEPSSSKKRGKTKSQPQFEEVPEEADLVPEAEDETGTEKKANPEEEFDDDMRRFEWDTMRGAEESQGLGPQMGKYKLQQALALGTQMVTSKKARMRMVDDLYNRDAWSELNAPSWFLDKIVKYSRRTIPVDETVLDKVKERFLDINARPIKKIAEAKARKKMRLEKQLEKMRDRATKIASNSELSTQDKMKQLDQLYKVAARKRKSSKRGKVLVCGPSRKRIGGAERGRTVIVDRRMKKDKRAQMKASATKAQKHRQHKAALGISGKKKKHKSSGANTKGKKKGGKKSS
ncbi:pre-rRNA 2'-O-ribose RNA methyltransferase FTSJ3 [Pelomyxa schiedti]|nr:pre-rRNA 2'-O-ribose RNA methyltransferase FTSJ3 [Pelomyxa schiedti]